MKLRRFMPGSRLLGTALAAFGTVWSIQAVDYSQAVLSQAPVGYWRLNETIQPPTPPINATNIGSVGSTGDGVYTSAARGFTPGALAGDANNACVQFTGATDGNRVRIPYASQWNPTSAYSVEFWAKPGQTASPLCPAASVEFIASPVQRNGWLFYQANSGISTGNGWVFRQYNTTGLSAVTGVAVNMTLDTSTWYHVVGVFDGTALSLYVNGVLAAGPTAISGSARGNTNSAIPMAFGARSDGASGFFTYNGLIDEGAMYSTALTAAQVLAHYQAGTNASANTYRQTVLNDHPVGYWPFNEPPDAIAANSGSLGAATKATVSYGSTTGVAGPQSPAYGGFETDNHAVKFDGTAGAASIPALNLNTNTVTISGWIKPNGSQQTAAGLVFCRANTTVAGLNIDAVYGGLGLGYTWANAKATYNWSPSADSGLPYLPDSEWAFFALVVQPDKATIYMCDATNYANFMGVVNTTPHPVQAFDSPTMIATDTTSATRYFNGMIDEVAIYKRALTGGELYTQYAAALGNVPPRVFVDPQAPVDPLLAGDTLALTVDAGGTPDLSYQWRKGGSILANATTSAFTKASITSADNGDYDCIVSNRFGKVTSVAATIAVGTAASPTITSTQGFLNRTLYPKATLSLAVTASGGGVKYQWYKDNVAIDGATNAAFNINSVTNSDAGAYKVTVSNGLGSANAGPVQITIPTLAAGSYEALVVAAAPEAWWRLDETAGSTNLFDGMGRHDGCYTNLLGTTPPVTLGVPGALGTDPNTAASFTASNQGVGLIPYSGDLNPITFTVEGWVKTTTLDADVAAFGSITESAGWYWRTYQGNWVGSGPSSYAPLATYNNQSPIVSDEWTYVVVNYSAARGGFPWAYYINGVTDGYNWSGSSYNTTGPFIIGGKGVNPTTIANAFFTGQVDEVAVYKRLLSAAEVTSHFQGRFGVTTVPYFTGAFVPQTVTPGKSVSFTTTVKGSVPITLQWYKNGAPVADATNSTLTFASTVVADTGLYTLWATNTAGVNSQSVSLTVIEPVGFANVTNGLVLHLKLDGDTADSSGRGNNGTQVGSPSFITGIVGTKALQYTTETDTNASPVTVTSASYVDLGLPSDLRFGASDSFTIGLWVKLPTGFVGGDLPFIGTATNSNNNPGWDLSPTYQTGGWQWCLDDGSNVIGVNSAGSTINDGAWHHYVLTVDRANKVAKTYLDELLVSTKSISALGSIDNGSPVIIGQDPTGLYPEAGSATLDDLGIWRRVLTPLEITSIYSAGYTSGRSFDTVNPAVTITVTRTASTITLSWSSGTLLESSSLGAEAVWTAVPGASAPSYTFTPGPGKKFYRVLVQ